MAALRKEEAPALSDKFKRYHPLFPTEDEVKSGTPVLSDHLPVMGSQRMAGKTFKFISWNVLGVGQEGNGFDADETGQQAADRAKRIIKTIESFIRSDRLKPSAILLQEVPFLSGEEKREPEFKEVKQTFNQMLKDTGWEYKGRDIATLYNPRDLEMKKQEDKKADRKAEQKLPKDIAYRTLTSVFHLPGQPDSKDNLVLHNVHWQHQDFPQQAEHQIRQLFEQEKEKEGTLVVVGGDFNNRLVGRPGVLYLTNGIVPKTFRQGRSGGYPGADFTDGFFKTDGGHFYQERDQINPEKVDFMKVERPDITQWPEQQQAEVKEFRPCMGLMPALSLENEEDEKKFDQLTRTHLYAEEVFVGMSANALNERRLAIQFQNVDNKSYSNCRKLRNLMKEFFAKDEKVITTYRTFVEDEKSLAQGRFSSWEVIHVPNTDEYKEKCTYLFQNYRQIDSNRELLLKASEKIQAHLSVLEKKEPPVTPLRKNKIDALTELKKQVDRWYVQGGFTRNTSFSALIEDLKMRYPQATAGVRSRTAAIFNELVKYDAKMEPLDSQEHQKASNRMVYQYAKNRIDQEIIRLESKYGDGAEKLEESKSTGQKKIAAWKKLSSDIDRFIADAKNDVKIDLAGEVKQLRVNPDVTASARGFFGGKKTEQLLTDLERFSRLLYLKEEKNDAVAPERAAAR